MASTAETIKERRLDRMRLGQAVCDYVTLISDPEIRLAIVPLTEAEYLQALEAVSKVNAPADVSGMQIRDRRQVQEITVRAVREDGDLVTRVWNTVSEMMASLDVADIDQIFDAYQEMAEKSSPSMEGLTGEDFENLRQAFLEMEWNELSGRAWFAFKRFLSTVIPQPLLGNSLGSGLTNSSTTTSGLGKSTRDASQNSTRPSAKSATNP